MKTIEFGKVIEVDEETDSLLQRVAETEGDIPDSQILRAAIPDKKEFVDYLKRHNLTNTPEAKAVLAQLGAEATKRAPLSVAARVKKKEREILAHVFAGRQATKRGKVKVHRKPRMGRNPVTGQVIKIKAKTARKKMRKAKRHKVSKTPRR